MSQMDAWTDREYAESSSGGQLYVISRKPGTDTWGCSCRGWTSHGKCKHLTERGYKSARQPTGAPRAAVSTPPRRYCEWPDCRKLRRTMVQEIGLCTAHAKEYRVMLNINEADQEQTVREARYVWKNNRVEYR